MCELFSPEILEAGAVTEGVNVSDSMRFSGWEASHYTACHQTHSAAAQRRKMSSGRVSHLSKLQALVYDILPLEEGAGKQCSECAIYL